MLSKIGDGLSWALEHGVSIVVVVGTFALLGLASFLVVATMDYRDQIVANQLANQQQVSDLGERLQEAEEKLVSTVDEAEGELTARLASDKQEVTQMLSGGTSEILTQTMSTQSDIEKEIAENTTNILNQTTTIMNTVAPDNNEDAVALHIQPCYTFAMGGGASGKATISGDVKAEITGGADVYGNGLVGVAKLQG